MLRKYLKAKNYTIKDLNSKDKVEEMPDNIFELLLGDRERLKKQKIKNKRRDRRRKNSFGAVIFKEGYETDEGGCHGYKNYVVVKEGKINKKVIKKDTDKTMCSSLKIIRITPKTKEAFIELRSSFIGDYNRLKGLQSVYLIKGKKKEMKLIFS